MDWRLLNNEHLAHKEERGKSKGKEGEKMREEKGRERKQRRKRKRREKQEVSSVYTSSLGSSRVYLCVVITFTSSLQTIHSSS